MKGFPNSFKRWGGGKSPIGKEPESVLGEIFY